MQATGFHRFLILDVLHFEGRAVLTFLLSRGCGSEVLGGKHTMKPLTRRSFHGKPPALMHLVSMLLAKRVAARIAWRTMAHGAS
jgi:hypothetical protein